MPRFNTVRLVLVFAMFTSLLPAFAQSQENQSVAEAARRAREQKKPKPAKVITDEDIKPASQGVPSISVVGAPVAPAAAANQAAPAPASAPSAATVSPTDSAPSAPAAPGAPANQAAPGAPAAPGTAPNQAADSKDQKTQPEPKEVTELKAQVKQALDDLKLVQREQSLEEDKFFSNTDYSHDNAGKAKLEDLKRQAAEKQQKLDQLKEKLAALLASGTGGANP